MCTPVELEHKTIIVTGGAGLLGRAIARELQQRPAAKRLYQKAEQQAGAAGHVRGASTPLKDPIRWYLDPVRTPAA